MKELYDFTVLVVDDTEIYLDILSDTLGDTYNVIVAMDGPKALEAADKNLPDLILLDIMMPGMDGYEVCEKLKASKKTRGIPVIFVTAKDEVTDEVRGFTVGAVDYIAKPISAQTVKARVATHLKLRKAERDLQELVEKTLGGAIGVLTDILSISNPSAFSRASLVKSHVEKLAARLNMDSIWQIKMAAMLSQIGCVTLSSETIEKIYREEEVSPEEKEAFDRHPVVGYGLINKIPNLKEVAEIIARQQMPETDTGFGGSDEMKNLIQTGSRILKLALDYEQMLFTGKSSSDAMTSLRSDAEKYGIELIDHFSFIIEEESSQKPIRRLRVRELVPGMVINKDILTKKGNLLISAGTEVSLPVYETLHNFSKTGFIDEPFEVLVPEPQ